LIRYQFACINIRPIFKNRPLLASKQNAVSVGECPSCGTATTADNMHHCHTFALLVKCNIIDELMANITPHCHSNNDVTVLLRRNVAAVLVNEQIALYPAAGWLVGVEFNAPLDTI